MVFRTNIPIYRDSTKQDELFEWMWKQAIAPNVCTVETMTEDAWETLPCFIDKAYFEDTSWVVEIWLDEDLWWSFLSEHQEYEDRCIYFTYWDQEYSIEKIIQNWIPYNIRDDRVNWVEELLSEI